MSEKFEKLIAFKELGLSGKTLKALEKKGFTEPTPIQKAAIPILLQGEHDVIGQALTGTGKTAAFALPIIECLKTESYGDTVKALILTPTRELAMQVATEFESLAQHSALKCVCVYGGQSIDIQIKVLRKTCDVIVGTPGRVIDLMNRGIIELDELQFAVLDEADEMLNMGFVEDIEYILEATPSDKKMLLFSATMPEPIMKIAENFMREYEIVNVNKNENTNTDLTEQIYYEVKRVDKFEALLRIIDAELDMYAIVFCRTRNDVDELLDKLLSANIRVEALHGEISQLQRTKVINNFKSRKFNILLATDVAARGIDVKTLTHVINYSIPESSEIYVHRIGRTGRAGNTGTAITFVTPGETRRIAKIRKELNVKIEKRQLPEGAEIVQKKIAELDEVWARIITNNHHKCYQHIANKMLAKYDAEELVAAILRNSYKNTLIADSYKKIGNSPSEGDQKKGKKKKKESRFERDGGEPIRLFFGIGKNDGVGAKKLLDMIFDRTGIKSYMIGKVDCYDKFSYATVSENDAAEIIAAFKRGKGKKINVEYAK